jgi:ribosomal-protein-alanine N-acetyltransferase
MTTTRRKPPPPVAKWVPLETPRLILRDIRPADHDDCHEYAIDPQVIRYMDWGPNTPAITRKVMAGWMKDQLKWPRAIVNMAVEHQAHGKMIGALRFAVIDQARLTCDFGYSFNSGYWNQGYATEAAGALLPLAFDTLGLHRMIATCDARNTGSWRVMEKLGMRREALFHHDVKARDGWRDSYLYALLADEWRAGAGG